MDPTDLHERIKRFLEWITIDRFAALIAGIVLAGPIIFWLLRRRDKRIEELSAANNKLTAENKQLDRNIQDMHEKHKREIWDLLRAHERAIDELRDRADELRKERNDLLDTVYSLEETIEDLRRQLKRLKPDSAPKSAEELIGKTPENGEIGASKAKKVVGPRYWVLAPHSAEEPEEYRRAWQFDLANKVISIGWAQLGDISSYDEIKLRREVDRVYPDVSAQGRGHYSSMLWKFYHCIKVGDSIIARQGGRRIAAVGTVTRAAYYRPNWSPARSWYPDGPQYPNHIDVNWQEPPLDKLFPKATFGQLTVYEIPEDRFYSLVGSKEVTGNQA